MYITFSDKHIINNIKLLYKSASYVTSTSATTEFSTTESRMQLPSGQKFRNIYETNRYYLHYISTGELDVKMSRYRNWYDNLQETKFPKFKFCSASKTGAAR